MLCLPSFKPQISLIMLLLAPNLTLLEAKTGPDPRIIKKIWRDTYRGLWWGWGQTLNWWPGQPRDSHEPNILKRARLLHPALFLFPRLLVDTHPPSLVDTWWFFSLVETAIALATHTDWMGAVNVQPIDYPSLIVVVVLSVNVDGLVPL